MNTNFKLYSYIFDFDDYNRTYIVNSIPSINRDIRIHMLDEIYNLEKSKSTHNYIVQRHTNILIHAIILS